MAPRSGQAWKMAPVCNSTMKNAKLVHDAQRAVASNSKPSVPSKTGQWLQEVAHHGNTSKLSLQGCSNVQIMQLNMDKAPTRLSSTHEMVGGVTKVPSRLSSTLEMVDGLSTGGWVTSWVRKDPAFGLLVSSVVQTAHCHFTFFLFA